MDHPNRTVTVLTLHVDLYTAHAFWSGFRIEWKTSGNDADRINT